MKFKRVFVSFLGLMLISNISLADNKTPMEKYLSNLRILNSDDGRTLETFEDVILNLDPYQKKNTPYPLVYEDGIPESYVNKSTAKKYFNSFLEHAVLTDDEIEFKDFFNEYFYLTDKINKDEKEDSDSKEKTDNNIIEEPDNTKSPIVIKGFPYEYNAVTPGSNILFLCMEGGYRYVDKFKEYKPDALSCRDCKSLCGKKCANGHAYGANNIYSSFKDNILDKSTIVEAEEIGIPDKYQEVGSKENYIEILCKDRTPPVINFNFMPLDALGPDVENSKRGCTTGDWYPCPSVEVKDNLSKEVYAKYTLGRIYDCPLDGQSWQDCERWDISENIRKIKSVEFNQVKDDKPTGYKYKRDCLEDVIYMPNYVGELRYCIFAKEDDSEGDGNLNPSCFNIRENSPESAYGYSEDLDLGNTPSTAQDWIDKRKLTDQLGEGKDKGSFLVYDNDNPNIIIRITEVKTGAQLFFPPCVASSAAKISNSSLYEQLNGRKNEDDYKEFVENLGPEYNYKAIAQTPLFKPYFTIFSVNDKTVKTEKEEDFSYFYRLLLNHDLKFINENVRVEDYFFSDTNEDGSKDYNSQPGIIGKRNGTFQKMEALLENSGDFFIKTDVEYKLDVWTDDNVKWSNADNCEAFANNKGSLTSTAQVFHTGIRGGIIRLDVPNIDDGENLSQEQKIDITKNINGEIYFKLRSETRPLYNLTLPEELEENDFPSILVEVEDFSGLLRKIRLFFRVNDRNLAVRVLEDKNKKKKK